MLATFDRELGRLMRYDALAVFLVGPSGLTPVYASGQEFRDLTAFQEGPASLEVARTVRDRRPTETVGTLIFPIEHQEQVTALLLLHGGGDLALLQTIAAKLAASIANATGFRRVEQLAESDPETGLANIRSLFQRLDAEIARARRSQSVLAVIQCSIQGFDRSGLLCSPSTTRVVFQKIAGKLRESCREYDFAARSGDDLVVVLPGFPSRHLAEKSRQIRGIVEAAGVNAGLPLYARLGASFFPSEGADAEDLLAIASCRVLKQRSG